MDDEDEPPMSPLERRLYGLDKSPPSPELADLARPFVDRVKLTFKLFRRDYESIGAAISEAHRDAQLSRQQASDLYLDLGHAVSIPLVERYLDARACGKIADWLRSRGDFHATEWLCNRNRIAIEGFIAQGESSLAVQLLRQHLHRMMVQTRAAWRFAAQQIKARDRGIELPNNADPVARLSGELELALFEIAECEIYIAASGAKSDLDALAEMRAEIMRARKRYVGS